MNEIFQDELIENFMLYKECNPDNFGWWNYVNAEADIDMALAFAKFYCPDILIKDGYILLKDKYHEELFAGCKKSCKSKKEVEQMMNLYSVEDFFHIKQDEIQNYEGKVVELGKVLKFFWELSFKSRFLEKQIQVDLFEQWGEHIITVYETD